MSSVSSISLTPSKLAWRGFSWITSTSCNVRYIIRFLDHLDCVFQVIASIPTRQLQRLYAKVYWYCEDADRTNRWKHSMTLSRLDMYDTLACHPVGLGNVSSKHFIDRLNALTFTSPRYAKYCYPFTSVLFNNPIPLWNWQTMLSRTNWHHSYRCKTITALFTENLVHPCWRYSQSPSRNENAAERVRQVIWVLLLLEVAKTTAGLLGLDTKWILRAKSLSVSKRLRIRGTLVWRR